MSLGVRRFHGAQASGKVIDADLNERFAYRENCDAIEAYKIIYEPLEKIIETPMEERTVTTGNGAYDSGKKQTVEEIKDLSVAYKENVRNMEIFFNLTLEDGHRYQFEAVPRTDFDPATRVKPPAFMELQHQPHKHESTNGNSEHIRFSLRYAMSFEDDYLDSIEGLPEDTIDEIDLLTAFYREDGIHDQLEESSLDFSPLIREDMKILQADGKTVSKHVADETVPYLTEYLTDDFKDGGYSQEEQELAGKHIGTANALGLNFRHEREAEELFGAYSKRFGRNMVHIDPEGGIHTTDETALRNDRALFVQQVVPPGDRESHHEIEKQADELTKQVENADKNWKQVLPEELPRNWRDELPEKFIL
ncbi:hypothetical protein [Candidatus Nanohalococcus occultus]|uniref:Uncharacterized protein n=1 Tax=Candidatus Nanohalococcus occultus TaxID=2978047 RepID=A0ABY8CGH3_9ARCH|nr:hypothetical protein SVXNc_0567 [Candidatus Nanohaloarchaeota archaeon SVXNc]